MRISEWIRLCENTTLDQYHDAMQVKWGGFLEVVIFRHVFATPFPSSFSLVHGNVGADAGISAVIGQLDAARCELLWSGTRWQIAPLSDGGWDQILRWTSG